MSGLIFFAFRDIKPLVSLAFFGTIQAIIQIRNYNIRAKKLGIIWFDTRSSHEKKIICKKLLCVIIDQVPPSDRAIVYELDGAYHYRNIEKTAYHHYVSREGYRTIVEWSLTQQRLKFKNTTITIDPNNPNLSKNIGEFRIFMSLFNDLYEHFYTYESDRRKVIQHAATIFDAKTTKYIEHLVNGYDYDLAFGEAYGTFDVSKTK